MKSKKGQLGTLISMFFAIILVAIILGGFILLSEPFKIFAEEPVLANYFGEDGEEREFFIYMDEDYEKLVKARFYVAGDYDVDAALVAGGFENG